ncbi:MAG: hypothetical protein JW959_04980 [Pirellulales bacterium]|nr:hypothetical protein [Pirellulales bacterium]
MNRNFAWMILIVAGIAFGTLLGDHPTDAQAPKEVAAERRDEEIIEQLKQVNAQLKELNTMFRTGTAKVVDVINPEVK